jgi:glycosyltransferase involved in cell wall biosynthesis
MPIPLSVIILTFNEEKNIRPCLDSIVGWAGQILIVDSGSTDQTLEIAQQYPVEIFSHPFENYSLQRNWAFDNLPIQHDWVMNLDADHSATSEIKEELTAHFGQGIPSNINGFMASRRTLFMGKWLKRGGQYPVYHGVVFRKGFGRCEEKEYDQHFVISGEAITLRGDINDIITDSLTNFTTRHNKWATLEALDAFAITLPPVNDATSSENKKLLLADKNGNAMQQHRYLRLKYYGYPLFWRVFFYFLYRYFFKLGILDGKQGLIFHFLQGFWFRFLVDAKIYEILQQVGSQDPAVIRQYIWNHFQKKV